MSQRVFLKFEGGKLPIKGEVSDAHHLHWIEVLTFTLGAAPGHGRAGGPRNEASVTKEVDRATPDLFRALTNGETFKQAILDFWDTETGASKFSATMSDVAISSINFGGDHPRDPSAPVEKEQVNMTFAGVTRRYAAAGGTGLSAAASTGLTALVISQLQAFLDEP